MGKFVTGKMLSALVLGASTIALTGCVGGPTYGTGVTQEAQLLKDLEGMMSFGSKKKKVRINHSARPNLIMPANTAALPVPLDQESSSSNVNWPESPEHRIARIRGEAEEEDPRSGAISVEELKRKKVGIGVDRDTRKNRDLDKDGHWAIVSLREGTHKQPKMLKKKNTKSTKRRYLTEPPNEYRTPLSTAPIGDLGISEAEKEKRAEKAAKLKFSQKTGMWNR